MLSIPADHLKYWGWKPWQLWTVVEWCGHRVEGIRVPHVDGQWRPAFTSSLVSRLRSADVDHLLGSLVRR